MLDRGVMPEIAAAARTINERLMVEVAEYLADQVKPWYRTNALKVTVMGLAFKGQPETNDLRGSTAIPLLAELRRLLPEARFCGYDPIVSAQDLTGLGLTPHGRPERGFRRQSSGDHPQQPPGVPGHAAVPALARHGAARHRLRFLEQLPRPSG